ncbi:MAG TPA: DUF1854 domain-containing protein [Clostridiales bacterium]|nr:DUF1854 domain-containing protein [Clostridiales bacterium]
MDIRDYAEIRYLDPEKSKFENTKGGFVSLKIEPEELYTRVNLHKAFPFTLDREYISVRYIITNELGMVKDSEIKEVGIIRRIDDFPADQVELIEKELAKRYFVPVIEKIQKVKEEFGYIYWDVLTSAGQRRFTTHDMSNSLIPVGENRLVLVDVDGNRFEIPDHTQLEDKHRKFLDMWL